MNKPPTIEATAGHEDVFDIAKALNKAGFAEFLGRHADYQDFDMEDASFISKKFEIFEKAESVKKRMTGMYKKQIQEEMGLVLGDDDMKCMTVDLEAKAVESPEDIVRLCEKMDSMDETTKTIESLESQISSFGNRDEKAAQLSESREKLEKTKLAGEMVTKFGKAKVWSTFVVASMGGFVFDNLKTEAEQQKKKISAYKEMVDAQEDKKLDGKKIKDITDSLGEEIKGLEQSIKNIDDNTNLKNIGKDVLGKLRSEMISGVSAYQGIQNAIRLKVKDQLLGFMKKGTVEGFDKAQEKLDTFKKSSENLSSGVDPLLGSDVEGIQEKIDEGIAYQANLVIENALKNSKLGSNSFSNMERAFKSWLDRQRLGSKEGDSAREAIKNMFIEARSKLTDSPTDKAKFVMLSTIIKKIK